MMIKTMLWVSLGGALGSVCRWSLTKLICAVVSNAFPWATLSINLFGCVCIGLLYAVCNKNIELNTWLSPFLITGFCGGFTTFSTFSYESLGLLKHNEPFYFALYVLASVGLGLVGVWAGMALGAGK